MPVGLDDGMVLNILEVGWSTPAYRWWVGVRWWCSILYSSEGRSGWRIWSWEMKNTAR